MPKDKTHLIEFNARDWLSSANLKICSMESHGLLINIMSLMKMANTKGVIDIRKYDCDKSNINLAFSEYLSKILPFEQIEIESSLSELLKRNVLVIDGEFLICKRMNKDESKSFNKNTKSYMSNKVLFDWENTLVNTYGVERIKAKELLACRKTKRLTNTKTALKTFVSNANKCKLSVKEVVDICVENSWGGFKPSYLEGNYKKVRKNKLKDGGTSAIITLD